MSEKEFRDEIAKLMLKGFVDCFSRNASVVLNGKPIGYPGDAKCISEICYEVADAMLAAREVKHD